MKPWKYLILLFMPALVVAGYFLGGAWNFGVPAFCFVAYPIINYFMAARGNSADAEQEIYPTAAYSRIALVFVPVLLFITGWAVYEAGSASLSRISFTGMALSVGIVNGVIGFTLAHEFIHRRDKVEKTAGYLLLLQNNYMHYGIEHVWGHHVYACTPEDPNTARTGESLYAYLPRAIYGTYRSALKIETRKLEKAGHKFPLAYSRMVGFGALQILLTGLIYYSLGSASVLFFLLQNAIAICLLHIADYLQHYGLIRAVRPGGSYERLNAYHAWNTGRYNPSLNLFQLESHADHHMHPSRPYDKLAVQEESPSHPAGYSFMLLLSLLPPLWFKVMDKRIPLPQNVLKIVS